MSEKEKNEKSSDGIFGETIKKVLSVGVGAAFMTEDVVKKYLNDLPLPKDMVQGLLQNARSAKEDFLSTIQDEVRNKLSKVDPKKLLEEVLENYDIDVQAKVKFTKKEQDELDEHN